MIRNILPPLPLQFTVPGLKLSSDGFNLLRLLPRVHCNLSQQQSGPMRTGHLPDGTGSVFFDAFAELLKHFNGGADLDGGGCLHDGCQMWMPREGL
jgi:hypothetical protein